MEESSVSPFVSREVAESRVWRGLGDPQTFEGNEENLDDMIRFLHYFNDRAYLNVTERSLSDVTQLFNQLSEEQRLLVFSTIPIVTTTDSAFSTVQRLYGKDSNDVQMRREYWLNLFDVCLEIVAILGHVSSEKQGIWHQILLFLMDRKEWEHLLCIKCQRELSIPQIYHTCENAGKDKNRRRRDLNFNRIRKDMYHNCNLSNLLNRIARFSNSYRSDERRGSCSDRIFSYYCDILSRILKARGAEGSLHLPLVSVHICVVHGYDMDTIRVESNKILMPSWKIPAPVILLELYKCGNLQSVVPFRYYEKLKKGYELVTHGKFHKTLWTRVPEFWKIILLRTYRDAYWELVYEFIREWCDEQLMGWDVMHCIIEYTGDASYREDEFPCQDLLSAGYVLRSLRSFVNSSHPEHRDPSHRVDNYRLKEWIQYFADHRMYKESKTFVNALESLLKANDRFRRT